jgi:hypothetical protein
MNYRGIKAGTKTIVTDTRSIGQESRGTNASSKLA